MVKIFEKWLGTREERTEKKYRVKVQRINDLEPILEGLTDQQLKGKTAEFVSKPTESWASKPTAEQIAEWVENADDYWARLESTLHDRQIVEEKIDHCRGCTELWSITVNKFGNSTDNSGS